jgi:hypothetical protein
MKSLSSTQGSDFFKRSVTIAFDGAVLITLILDKYQQNLSYHFQITIYHHILSEYADHSFV